MEYGNLGLAGLKVSRICLGTNMMGAYVDDQGSATLIHSFLDGGGNFIDTADIYSQGASETAIGKALKGRRQDAILATKVHGPMGDGPNDRGTSRHHVLEGAEASLRRLQTDYLDLFILHRWDPETRLPETLRAMDDLVRDGKVRYFGVSNFTAWQTMKTLWVGERMGLDPAVSLQIRFSMLHREAEAELIPMAIEQGLGLTPYWVLEAGALTGKYRKGEAFQEGSRFASRPQYASFMNDQTDAVAGKVEEIATRAGRTPTEVIIAWALSRPGIASVILGSSRVEQVVANNEAVNVLLSEEELAELDQLGRSEMVSD